MSLKIATTSAIGWPYVRRGNRFTYELALYLARQGHQVHHITAKPGKLNREKKQEELLIKYRRLFPHPILAYLDIHFFETFVPGCLYQLSREKYDIVHCFLYPDAYAASLVKKFKRMALVPTLADGVPLYWPTRFGKAMFTGVVKRATRFHAPSEFIRQCLKNEFHEESEVIPLAVNTENFIPCVKKDLRHPRILCTAALSVGRKGVDILVNAFELLIKQLPNAVLQLSGHIDVSTKRKLLQSVSPDTGKAIEFRGIGLQSELPKLYREASITVLPSLNECFGMVTIESLASGTPVVGTRSGAIPEIITDPDIGVLFNHMDGEKGLCEAMMNCLELAKDSETPGRCRAFAEQYSWNVIGPKYEQMYYRILDEKTT
jgi:glycosyltransferase involved in cell wall biosynthesis